MYTVISVDFYINHRSLICLVSQRNIISCAENPNRSKYQAAIIHGRRRDGYRGRPPRENQNEDQVGTCESIDSSAEHTRDAPWAPNELTTVTG